ncbi:MAG: hypothetical protein AAFN74_25495, partial [Myxococcota bacterium]
MRIIAGLLMVSLCALAGCSGASPASSASLASTGAVPTPADLVIVNGRVYTLTWPDPDLNGKPSVDAPHGPDGWHPDAEAVAIRGDRIVAVGRRSNVAALIGPSTRVIDVQGATVIPGLIDSHTHIMEYG